MAEQVLRLFPSASLRRDGPGQLRYTGNPPSEPEFEMVKPISDGKGMAAIVISITEASPTRSTHDIIQEPPRAHLADDSSRAISPSLSNIELPPSPADGHADTSALADSAPVLQTSSPVLESNGGSSPTSVHSPVMRSMFPRFDPTIPLQQQRYYPAMEGGFSRIPDTAMTRPDYSPSCYSQSENIPSTKAGYVHPTSPNLPTTITTLAPPPEPQPEFSSPSDLLSLWSLANGQGLSSSTSTYTLQLECSSSSTIHLLSSHSTPFYSLHFSPSHPIPTITRTHPTTLPPHPLTIFQPTLHPLPLFASLFPTTAEFTILNQPSTHTLPRPARAQHQAEALVRAHALHRCTLSRDPDTGTHILSHPTLGAFAFALRYHPRSGQLSGVSVRAPPLVSGRGTGEELVGLEMSTRALTVYAERVARLGGAYVLDSLVGALLTLLLLLRRQEEGGEGGRVVGLWDPLREGWAGARCEPVRGFEPPLRGVGEKVKGKRRAWAWAWGGGKRREARMGGVDGDGLSDGELEMAVWGSTQLQGHHQHHQLHFSPPPAAPPAPSHTSFPAFTPVFARDDPRLPVPTRVALRVLYAGFAGVVWVLGLLVDVLAAGVVAAGWVVARL